jgi:tRNA A58 N-methylase Trm61
VEHDKKWYEKIAPIVPQNVTISHVALEYGGAYAKEITAYKKKFDIIVIDGRDRFNCAWSALDSIKNNGVIIWYNSDQRKYAEGIKLLQDSGFRKIEFIGMCPGVNIKSETAIFYKDHNVLNI